MQPRIYKLFGIRTREVAAINRLLAFNQGCYNLFLAIGISIGLAIFYTKGNLVVAHTLVLFCCASMVCAGIALLFSGGWRLLPVAIMQAIFPLLVWISWLWF